MPTRLPLRVLTMGLVLLTFTTADQAQQVAGADHETQCRANMESLGEAVRSYLMLHRGQFPERISELYTEGLVAGLSTFVCPASNKAVLSADQIDELSDYVVANELAEPPIRLFHEKYGYHDGKALAFYSDRTFKLARGPAPPPPPTPAEPDDPTEGESDDPPPDGDAPSGARSGAAVRSPRPTLPPVSAVPDIPDIGEPPELPQLSTSRQPTRTTARRTTPPATDTTRRRPADTTTPPSRRPANVAAASQADELVKQGNELMAGGRFDEAAQSYRQAIGLAPGSAPAHNGLGAALARKGDWAGAEASFRTAVRCDPSSYVYAGHVAIALMKQKKNLPEAEQFLARAIQIKPDEADLHYQHGGVLRFQERWAESEAAYRRAIELKPDSAKYYADMTWTLIAQGKTAEARQAVAQARQLGLKEHAVYARVDAADTPAPPPPLPPDDRQIEPDMTRFAQVLWAGQYDEALKEIRALSAKHPDHAQVNVSRGLMELVYQQNDAATAIAKRLLKKHPNQVNVLVLRGQAAYWSGDAATARRMFARAVQVEPNAPGAYFQQASDFYKRQLWIMAYYQFVTVTQLGGPGSADACYWLGLTCEQLNDPNQAVTWYRAYVQAQPNSPWTAQAQAAIERLQAAGR